jgi:hypothetical protein
MEKGGRKLLKLPLESTRSGLQPGRKVQLYLYMRELCF